MKLTGVRHRLPMSAMSRLFALAAALMVTFACLADVAHAVGGEADGCPQGKLESKLESQPSPVSSGDSAILPVRFEPDMAPMLDRVVDVGRGITTSFVFARPAAPRAPPIA